MLSPTLFFIYGASDLGYIPYKVSVEKDKTIDPGDPEQCTTWVHFHTGGQNSYTHTIKINK